MTGNPEHNREGLPLSSPTPWPSGPPWHRQQHQSVSFKKLKNLKKPKKSKKVKKVTSYGKKWKNFKEKCCESGRKLKNKKVTQKSRIQYKKRNKNQQSISINPNLTHRHVYNFKNSSIQYKSHSKNSIKNRIIPTKRNPPLKNRIKMPLLVTFYMIICLVLETYSVTQELGNNVITRTYPKNDETGINIQTLKGSHKSNGTGVCILEKGINRLKSKKLHKLAKSNKKVGKKVKQLEKLIDVFSWLNNSDKQGNMTLRNPIEYIPRIKISDTYSQAVIDYIKYTISVQHISYVSVFNYLGNMDGQSNSIYNDHYKYIPVSEIGFAHFQAVIFNSKHEIIGQHKGHIGIITYTQPWNTLHMSLRCASLPSLQALGLSDHHLGPLQKNKLHDYKMANKLCERPMLRLPTPAVRTVPIFTWSSSNRAAAWLGGQGEEVMVDLQTRPADHLYLFPGPPEAQVLDLVVDDFVGRAGGGKGELVKDGPKFGPSLKGLEVSRPMGWRAMTESEAQAGKTESGAVNVETESGAESELKEVSKKRLNQLELLNGQDFLGDWKLVKINVKNTLNYKKLLGCLNPIPGDRLGIPITIKGWGKGRNKTNEAPG